MIVNLATPPATLPVIPAMVTVIKDVTEHKVVVYAMQRAICSLPHPKKLLVVTQVRTQGFTTAIRVLQ